MSLKAAVSKQDLLRKVKEGQIVKGTVQTVKDYGIFVQLLHSPLVGFVHKSLISDKFVKDVGSLYSTGQGDHLPAPTVPIPLYPHFSDSDRIHFRGLLLKSLP